jgi:hypothetical protein
MVVRSRQKLACHFHLGSRSGCLGSLGDQTFHRRGSLGTHATPVRQTVLGNADAFFIDRSAGVVETDALNETAITAVTLIGHNDIEKRACFCTATGESNNDHDLSFGVVEKIQPVAISAK